MECNDTKTTSAVLSGQTPGNHISDSYSRKDKMFNEEFRKLAKSPIFLLFACALTLWAIPVGLALYDCYDVLKVLFQSRSLGFGVFLVQLAFLVTILASVWKTYCDARKGSSRKPSGVGIMLCLHWVMLVIVGLGFAATLPVFTEILPYSSIYDMPLQILYALYIILIAYLAIAIGVITKIHNNLAFWDGSTGPITALVVIYIVHGLSLLVGLCLRLLDVSVVFVLLSLIFLIILLFKYMKIIKTCSER